MTILTQRALLLVKREGTVGSPTPGVDAVPVVGTDAIQIINPTFTVDVQQLDRKFAVRDFSKWPSIPGRKIAHLNFDVEIAPALAGPATAPKWATLLEGCGMLAGALNLPQKTIATSSGAVRVSNIATITTTTAHGFSVGQYVIIAGVTTDTGFNVGSVVMAVPSATTFTYVNTGANATGTTASATATVNAAAQYTPTTDSAMTLTFYLYFDGWFHKITGAAGTFSMTADSGNIGMLTFAFQGNYVAPVLAGGSVMPTGEVFSTFNPGIIEYSGVAFLGASPLVINAFKFDIANKIVGRQDMNAAGGFRGVRVADRNPTGGIDPEVDISHTFWSNLTSGTTGSLSVLIGGGNSGGVYTPGNGTVGGSIGFAASMVQVQNIVYGDRDGFRTYDLSLMFRRNVALPNGGDEFSINFY